MNRFTENLLLKLKAAALLGKSLLGLILIVFPASAEVVNFRTQILPVLTKAGCNAGACHGAATGQGGFKLSLLGYDPEEDYWTITRELNGRRVDMDDPGKSLFLRKPTGEIDHEGGRKIRKNSEDYRTLLGWLSANALPGSLTLQVSSLEVSPADTLLGSTNQEVQLRVTASYSDGTREDVTRLALFTSNDDGIAVVNGEGKVTTRGRGLSSIMVRYSGQVAAARVAVPFVDAAGSAASFQPRNFIDDEILKELKRLRIPSSNPGGDPEFLRRVFLDLTGRLPDIETARKFLAQPRSAAERQVLIEGLLGSEDFTDFWTMRLADLLLISGKRGAEEATRVYHQWLREQVAANKPWNEIAGALLTSQGDITRHGPANFYTLANDPRDMAEHVGNIFLSTQIGCARCHSHPSDRWTQKDYYQFAAYFTRIARDGGKVVPTKQGEIEYPKGKEVVKARPLGSAVPASVQEPDQRLELARWLTGAENPMFARSMVNRVWKHLMGRGLFEPVDDMRPTNPATHPQLLNRLAREFAGHNFDLRWLVRAIVSSGAYQLSSHTSPGNKLDDRFYSHAQLKSLEAQTMLDAISQVTGVAESFSGYEEGIRAVQLHGAQTPSYALDVLGRCGRERSCAPAGGGGGLAQALHLINGPVINEKLGCGNLAKFLAEGKTSIEIVEEFYLRALTRKPSAAEAAFWGNSISASADKVAMCEDFLWTLLNSREFAFNH